jgi:chemotaxis protein methyltransferase CheR
LLLPGQWQQSALPADDEHYTTDINDAVLQRAKDGIVPLNTIQKNTASYNVAGGTGTFSKFYTALYDYAFSGRRCADSSR